MCAAHGERQLENFSSFSQSLSAGGSLYRNWSSSGLRVSYGQKANFTLQAATTAQRGSICIAVLFLGPRRKMGWMVKVTTRPLYPRKENR